MQAVILAGGLGVRLRPLTEVVPKPMVPVGDRPFLWHLLAMMRDRGVRRFVLCTGYLGEQISGQFGDGRELGVEIAYSPEDEPLGTGGALKQAFARLEERFIVAYGDSYLPIDYADVMTRFVASGRDGLVVAYDNRDDTSVPNNLRMDSGDAVLAYDKESASPGLSHVDAGVLALRRGVVGELPDGPVSLEKFLFPRLIARGGLVAYRTSQRFYDIGTPERLETIRRLLGSPA